MAAGYGPNTMYLRILRTDGNCSCKSRTRTDKQRLNYIYIYIYCYTYICVRACVTLCVDAGREATNDVTDSSSSGSCIVTAEEITVAMIVIIMKIVGEAPRCCCCGALELQLLGRHECARGMASRVHLLERYLQGLLASLLQLSACTRVGSRGGLLLPFTWK
jgi:hypothetical protein